VKKYMYVVDYWVPFPASEYGGLVILIAENDVEALELLSEESLQYYNKNYGHLIMEKIVTATKLELADDYESGIIEVFCT